MKRPAEAGRVTGSLQGRAAREEDWSTFYFLAQVLMPRIG
jgi:hypothetical protein